MISVLTADIINSRKVADSDVWVQPLKACLSRLGSTPATWEIYRGDSVQVEIKDPLEVFRLSVQIKAVVKQLKHLDIRMAIGIGDKTYQADRITESNGPAFIRSGEAFENLKRSTTLAIATEWPAFDESMNLYLKLASVIMSGWKPATAEIVGTYLDNPGISQQQLAKRAGMKQPSVSDALSRASYYELMELDAYFRKSLKQQMTK